MKKRFFIWFLIAFISGILISVNGCSAVKKIADATNDANQHATAIRTEVVGAKKALAASTQPAVIAAVTVHLDAIDAHAQAIQKDSADITDQIPDVQDRVPLWERLLEWGLIVIAIGGIIFLLWRLNVLIMLEKGIQEAMTFVGRVIGAI